MNNQFLARGKRSNVYKCKYKGKEGVIKVKRKDSEANTINKEFNILKKLNKHNIGPKVYSSEKDAFTMEFIKGIRIDNFFKTAKKEEILIILKKIILKLKKLDDLKINKDEMSHPYKHIIVDFPQVKLIDFEKARATEKPSNLTQFCSFLMRKDSNITLSKKGIFIHKKDLENACKKYKRNYPDESFKRICNIILQKRLKERVFSIVSRIPKGETLTYKQVAKKANTKAYRFIGQCMKTNEFWPIVPCHRVVATNGIGGFSSPGGVKEKRKLLKKEGITI